MFNEYDVTWVKDDGSVTFSSGVIHNNQFLPDSRFPYYSPDDGEIGIAVSKDSTDAKIIKSVRNGE